MDSNSPCAGIPEEQDRLRTRPTGNAFWGVYLCVHRCGSGSTRLSPSTESRQR